MGGEILRDCYTERTDQSVLHVLRATDSCKDRLAALFHWNDQAGLAQALAVAREIGDEVDFEDLTAWAESEGAQGKYAEFARGLALSD